MGTQILKQSNFEIEKTLAILSTAIGERGALDLHYSFLDRMREDLLGVNDLEPALERHTMKVVEVLDTGAITIEMGATFGSINGASQQRT